MNKWRVGFMWNCPWRLRWHEPKEYWFRYQCGPFYLLYWR